MKNRNASIPSNHGVKAPNICYVAGRSGGHILPALTHARHHKGQYPLSYILFIATTTTLDKKLLDQRSWIDSAVYMNLDNIPKRKLTLPLYLFSMGVAFVRSLYLLKKHDITRVVSTGGYIGIPVCFAAYLLRIPIDVYELNVHPGKATHLLAPLSERVLVCFKSTVGYFPKKAEQTGYPLRYTRLPTEPELDECANRYGLSRTKRTLFVLGGSQGSLFLNTSTAAWLEEHKMRWPNIQVIHQTGSADRYNWNVWYQERGIPALVFDFMDDISCLYGLSHLIICRAGAGTLFEIAFFKKRALIIPLVSSATSHQVDNALAMVKEYPDYFSLLYQADSEKDSRLFAVAIEKGLALP